ncbi:hypothetical protein B5F86_00405 [Lachnoclostridium sp. An298]|nr:hypothetical protein B5F86_00405 [Lachnoclostridium sp. An298]
MEKAVNADLVIPAVGQRSAGGDLARALKDRGYDVTVIGDAKRPAKFINAVEEGYFTAISLD